MNMQHSSFLVDKILNKEAVVGIIGLGYVGLPLSLLFSEVGFRVLGFDIDVKKINMLNAGESYIQHISSSRISNSNTQGFHATTNFSLASEADALIICVPTPLGKHREPDLSFIINTINTLLPYLRKGQVLSLESTTYPGTTEEELLPRIESRGLIVGEDFFLVYSPEREDPGNAVYETRVIPKVVGGYTSTCLEVGSALYSSAVSNIVKVSSPKVAEMTKLLENVHRAVNIGLVNEMKILADRMKVDIYEVIRAASTKPFGFTPFFPGPGLGGHCIPIDPFYLTWKAREFNLHTRFIELAGDVNTNMPDWVINKVIDALNTRGKSLKGSKALVLGVSYKKDIDDTRESPALKLMELLAEKGALIHYSDPHVPVLPKLRDYHFDLSSIDPTPDVISRFDLLLLATDHSTFDYSMFQRFAQLIVDTRGVYLDTFPNVVKA